ncbi:haloacid dehalogenase superfamily, subfamily IA, variant 3 with third motif having DD or ED [Thermomonospora echinospora]|uniref:D,D-heptose 1,7-bisphosphate phosphatase n=1 Tax=Thermomonospora echinospora TaxID=1992 RepID=A0A1H6C026_9ACTN|nr:HAD-IIIA family hydrolase [Thermomonospora echinospora]SEG65756.1 haloacid dehalogenase superfamily, subfamily IA, variant 3 with third motif having DD or ED [Thermomonospora echinospora]
MSGYSVVVPTLGRPCLTDCLEALATSRGPLPERVVLVDDRPLGGAPPQVPDELAKLTEVVVSGGLGPAAARNLGWRCTTTPWVVFLDDDVRVSPGWREALAEDLAGQPPRVAGVQGRIEVPLPEDRDPTDWERGTAGLAHARWITADMAYRRAALVESGGFDERFPRAFREDADLALRLERDGWTLTRGTRRTVHPVRPASWWVSVRRQAGNTDDALMRALHGPGWHERAGETPGRRNRHLAITAAGVAAAALAAAGRRGAAALAAAGALAGVTEFAAARIAPGPRTVGEIATMAATSLVIPPAAVWHWLRGLRAAHGARPWPGPARAVLFDRDGTLVRDVPYNGDPAKVEPMPGAREAVELARRLGLRVGVVSNQSGIARGLLTRQDVDAVNRRVEELLGPFDTWQVCPHGDGDGCRCRKPAPGMVERAAHELWVQPHECVVVGDIGADVGAARAAGARSVLVPTPQTRQEESVGARVAGDLVAAVRFAAGDVPGAPLWP